jgi:hypothetical protein
VDAGPVVGVPSVWRVVVLPLTVKLRALQGAEEARAAEIDGCEGYAVWDEDGRVGTVVHARTRPSCSPVRRSTFAVRTGLFRRRVVLIPATEIDVRDPGRRRVTLRPRAPGGHQAVMPGEDAIAPRRPGW